MTEIKILVEGYVSADTGGRSCSTITLIRDKNLNIIADPGMLSDRQILVDRLKENVLTPNDINIVYITHSHMDHYRNIGLFPNAKALDYWGWWNRDIFTDYKGKVSENIRMIKTPGHSYDSTTLIIKTAEEIVAVCGDVFWKENFPARDPFASDYEKLKESRKKVLEIADFVIPGHGKMFKVEK